MALESETSLWVALRKSWACTRKSTMCSVRECVRVRVVENEQMVSTGERKSGTKYSMMMGVI